MSCSAGLDSLLGLQQAWLSNVAGIRSTLLGLVPYNQSEYHLAGKRKTPVVEINVLTLRISCYAFEHLAGTMRGRRGVNIRLMDSAAKPNLEIMFH